VDRPQLRDAHLEVREQLKQKGLELLVGAVDLVDEQDRRRRTADGGEERSFEQVFFREDVLLDAVGGLAYPLARLDGEELALIVPLVERRVLVEALVALKPDELAFVHASERLGDLGLAHAGLALEEKRPLEEIHQPQRHRKVAIGDVADLGKALGNVLAGQTHLKARLAQSPRKATRGPQRFRLLKLRISHLRVRVLALAATGPLLPPGLFVQPQLLRHHPGAPMVVGHGDVRRAEEPECVVDGVGEARDTPDIRALADPLGTDRMVR
jgi:hypothetical protein